MKYVIYNTENSPSLSERDMIWSVAPVADVLQITSTFSPLFIALADYPQGNFNMKCSILRVFENVFEQTITWAVMEAELKAIRQLRNKKMRTQVDQIILAAKEKWFRIIEKEFIHYLTSNLANYHYDALVPLTYEYVGLPDAEIRVMWAVEALDFEKPHDRMDFAVNIISNAIIEKDSLPVLDERLLPLTDQQPIEEYAPQGKAAEKPVIYAEKILRMPLCFTLPADRLRIARNEGKMLFSEFHNVVSTMMDEAGIKEGMVKLRTMLPELQHKIENSNFVQSANADMPAPEAVNLHLAFTSKREMLELFKQLNMLNDEQVLQAAELIMKQGNLNSLRPFMYIAHPQDKN